MSSLLPIGALHQEMGRQEGVVSFPGKFSAVLYRACLLARLCQEASPVLFVVKVKVNVMGAARAKVKVKVKVKVKSQVAACVKARALFQPATPLTGKITGQLISLASHQEPARILAGSLQARKGSSPQERFQPFASLQGLWKLKPCR